MLIYFNYRESDLANQGYYLIAQELVYQWLGSWVTPYWWTDAHVNKAIAGFLAASTANEVNRCCSKFLLFSTVKIYFVWIRLIMAKSLTENGL